MTTSQKDTVYSILGSLAIIGIVAAIWNDNQPPSEEELQHMAAMRRSDKWADEYAANHSDDEDISDLNQNRAESIAREIVIHPALRELQSAPETGIQAILKTNPSKGIRELYGLLLNTKGLKVPSLQSGIEIEQLPDKEMIKASFQPNNMTHVTFRLTHKGAGAIGVSLRSAFDYDRAYPGPGVPKYHQQGTEVEAVIGADNSVHGQVIAFNRSTTGPEEGREEILDAIGRHAADVERLCTHAARKAIEAAAKPPAK